MHVNPSNETDAEEQQKENDDDDNVDTLRLAFENLDIARVIYEKMPESEVHDQLIRTYQRLGDAGVEMGENENAVSDYRKALALLEKYLPANDSRIGQWFV